MGNFGFDIGVEGEESINGLFLALKNLPLHLTEDVHIEALKKAAKPIGKRLQYTVPEDTGLLASDFRIAKTKFKQLHQYQVIAGYRKRKGGHGFIAHMLEYGTEKMRARPFMRPADEYTKLEQETIYTAQIQVEVDKRIDGL